MPRISRRNFVAALGAASVSTHVARVSAAEPASPITPGSLSNRRPNVVLLICDDLGYGDLGCYGSPLLTPNLDRMADKGTRFLHYNGGHPICSASRGALMTGRYATRTGIRPVYHPKDEDGIPPTEITIASILHDQRYRTMCIGKWHLGQAVGHAPTDHGYDHYFGMPWSVDMKPLSLFRDNQVIEENTDASLLTPRYAKAATDFIEESSKQPFFLHVGFNYPHIPIAAGPRFKGKSKLGIYGDAVMEIDWAVGEILEALQRNGLDDNRAIRDQVAGEKGLRTKADSAYP
jgi:arylsulfatase A